MRTRQGNDMKDGCRWGQEGKSREEVRGEERKIKERVRTERTKKRSVKSVKEENGGGMMREENKRRKE